ncbi:MAG: sodium:alanine symporter family protein [Clostridia bacterium]|nr:sodium:alanine symporter family protein [Clostridia bacterium]
MLESVNNLIWNKIGVYALGLTGIFLTFALKFFQFRYFKLWCTDTVKNIFKKESGYSPKDKSAISPFQSMCTSLGATIGVGNIVGVASAIYVGGPGAVFWMWIAAIFGMMTGYCENVLGIYYRRKNFNGAWCGGAMYYLEDGVGSKKRMKKIAKILAHIYAFSTLLASFGIGSMGQVNKIVINLKSAFPIPELEGINTVGNTNTYSFIIGIIIFLIAAIVVIGGVKRLASVTEKLVPSMVVFFLLGSFVVIFKNYQNIIPAFKAVILSAFNLKAGCGATVGVAFSQGFKRGVFSNEAGMGSSVIIHSNSSTKEPAIQGMYTMFEIFTDTIVMCTVTALVVLTSGVYDLSTGKITGVESTLVAESFNSVFKVAGFGQKFVAISIFMFAFSSVLGWNHYGSKSWEYLFGTKTVFFYKLIHLASIIPGALLSSSAAWDISDIFNGLMIIPNLIGVILLFGTVKKITDNYIKRKKGEKILPLLSFSFRFKYK